MISVNFRALLEAISKRVLEAKKARFETRTASRTAAERGAVRILEDHIGKWSCL
jgi:hypothetical protein